MFRVALFAILFTITSALYAYDVLELGSDGILKSPPMCLASTGEEVIYLKVPAEYIWSRGAYMSMAGQGIDGDFFIWIDKDNFSKIPAEHQLQILAHECEHHELGHTQTDALEAMKQGGVDLDEEMADCESFAELVQIGFTDEQFDVLYESMVTIYDKIVVPPSKRKKINAYASQAYKQTPEQRVQQGKLCVEEARSYKK